MSPAKYFKMGTYCCMLPLNTLAINIVFGQICEMTHAQLFLGHSFYVMLVSSGFGFNIFSIAFLTSRLVILSFNHPYQISSHISCNELWKVHINVTIVDAKKESIFTIFVTWTNAQIRWQYIPWLWSPQINISSWLQKNSLGSNGHCMNIEFLK